MLLRLGFIEVMVFLCCLFLLWITMESTGEPERKRRHFSFILPKANPAVKNHLLAPRAEKKLDVAVLQIQNQKLFQQLEAQQAEYSFFEDKYSKLKRQQEIYEGAVGVANNSWKLIVSELESRSICINESANTGNDLRGSQVLEDGAFIPIQEDFLSRLFKTGATESCSYSVSADQSEYDTQLTSETTKNILQNIISSINWKWHVRGAIASSLQATFSDAGMQLQKSVNDLRMEVKSLIVGVNELHLKHRLLASNIQNHRDMDAKLKADQKRLGGELASTMSELEESNSKLFSLKAQRDGSNVAPIPCSKLGIKLSGVDMARNGQKEIQDLEASLKQFQDLATSSIVEIGNLHERKIEILKEMSKLQNVFMDAKNISSSRAFLMLKEQLDKSKMEMDQCRISLEKLQAENDSFFWHGKEVNVEANTADILRKICEFSKSKFSKLEQDLQNFIQDQISIETKLEETLRKKPGRKEIITVFKEFISSLPKDMETMQIELSKLKDSYSEIHCLRAQVQSLSALLEREADKLQSLFHKSAGQLLEIKNLHLVAGDLRESEQHLKLFLEMYRRESTDCGDFMVSRDMEYKARAHVQSLKSSLEEHKLESRVKAAIEAESITQQKLATADVEIVDLRQKLESYVKQIVKSTEKLKSKHEEGEFYLSEIESIRQSYEEFQTQNQHLLQEVTERDEYNIKLLMEGVKAKQLHNVVYGEIKTVDKKLYEADSLIHLYDLIALKFDEELKVCADRVAKLAVVGRQSSVASSNANRRLSDVYTESQELRCSVNETQIQGEKNRLETTEILIELERERFNKRRIEERLEAMKIKATSLKSQAEGSVGLEELQQEISEYRRILKCCICHERQKDAVITKCYHVFCTQCLRRIVKSRHRKCPTCSVNFGPNDIKHIYI